MAILQVKNRDFQRATGVWLQKAQSGNTIVIVSSQGPPLTLKAGRPEPVRPPQWDDHFAWLKQQPLLEENPVDNLRQEESR